MLLQLRRVWLRYEIAFDIKRTERCSLSFSTSFSHIDSDLGLFAFIKYVRQLFSFSFARQDNTDIISIDNIHITFSSLLLQHRGIEASVTGKSRRRFQLPLTNPNKKSLPLVEHWSVGKVASLLEIVKKVENLFIYIYKYIPALYLVDYGICVWIQDKTIIFVKSITTILL